MLLNIRGLGIVPNPTDMEMISGLNFARGQGTTQATTLAPADTKTDTGHPPGPSEP